VTGTRSVIFQSCTFDGLQIELGYNIFLHCTFRNAHLSYNGGDVLFDDDNTIEGDSQLTLSPNANRRPDVVKHLAGKFDFAHTAFPDPNKVRPAPVPSKH
jgi:hypothetical protein